jgi:hypothetical protein
MSQTNRERLEFLQSRVNTLAAEIEESGREEEFLSYVRQISSSGGQPRSIDEVEYDLMLPTEKSSLLLAHYHTMRTELLELARSQEQQARTGGVSSWLANPWLKAGISAISLTKAAMFIIEVLSKHPHFLRVPSNEPDPNRKPRMPRG